MKFMHDTLEWLRANPGETAIAIYLFTGFAVALFKPRTEEQWARLPAWLAGILKATSALGLDPVKLVEALVMILRLPAPGDGSRPKDPPEN